MTVFFKPPEKAPCMAACPGEIDVPRYVRHIAQGEFDQSLAVIREGIPFPSVCGYVCIHPCETECRSNLIDGPIAIRVLKRVVADKGQPVAGEVPKKKTGKKVAIVGAGPAGLTAAYHLARRGHNVTILEATSQPGGMMYWGITEYRLPKALLGGEIEALKATGVNIKTNSPVKSLDELKGYDAIFVAVGAQRGLKLGVPGDDLVQDALSFLKQVNSGEKMKISGRVCVVGGGNVAVDAARTALRLGAEKVTLVYRRSREEMPATSEEIDGAREEGVEALFQAVPTRVTSRNGRVALKCLKTELGAPDESGRREPVPIKGSEFSLDCDRVIAAVGQRAEIPGGFSPATLKSGTIKVAKKTLATRKKGVFAGGDVVSGPASVIEAIAAGKKAASAIDIYLGGTGNITEKLVPPEGEVKPFLPDLTLLRVPIPSLLAAERVKGFDLVEKPLSDEIAVTEAKRCLRCDLPIYVDTEKCMGCQTCEMICSLARAGRFSRKESHIHGLKIRGGADYEISFDEGCETCGLCVRYCPRKVLTREKRGGA